MVRIKIRNFGPITDGFTENDGFIDIKKITFFCGHQGSGKSTVAKLVSVFSWIEKALLRGDFQEYDVTEEVLKNERFEYLDIGNFFHQDTEIIFQGNIYTFTYQKNKLSLSGNKGNDYFRPKIMYIPAERNFISALSDNIANTIKGLPKTLYTLLDEYNKAKEALGVETEPMPIGDIIFRYDKQTGASYISNSNKTYQIAVQEAASGFQSAIPLVLISRYLSNPLCKEYDASRQPLTYDEIRRIKEGTKQFSSIKLCLQLSKKDISPEFKAVLDVTGFSYTIDKPKTSGTTDENEQRLLRFMSYFYNRCFLNIVEEPEQNLYPVSQCMILFDLLSCANKNEHNSLIVTTHSPYLITYLTLAIKAQQLCDNGVPVQEVCRIVPESALIHGEDVVLYELKEGRIQCLPTYKNMPSDENFLNNEISRGNELFDELLILEDKYQQGNNNSRMKRIFI